MITGELITNAVAAASSVSRIGPRAHVRVLALVVAESAKEARTLADDEEALAPGHGFNPSDPSSAALDARLLAVHLARCAEDARTLADDVLPLDGDLDAAGLERLQALADGLTAGRDLALRIRDSYTDAAHYFALANDLTDAHARTVALARALLPGAPGRRSGKRQVRTARRLVAAAARMLPAGDRARYAEEFRSELAEIALAGGGRAAQLGYAARQLMSSVRLRADLKAPRRRSAVP